MKILHIGDIAGVPTMLRSIDRNNSKKSEVVKTIPHNHNYDFDYFVPIHDKSLKSILNCGRLVFLQLKYDELHYHKHHIPFAVDVFLMKLLGKRVIVHYHGTDIRGNKVPLFHNLADRIYVSTLDLLKYAPKGQWLPNPIINNFSVSKYHKNNPFQILHAPTNRETKGTQKIIDAVSVLKSEGYKIDLKILENVANCQVLEEIKKSDLIIDWVNDDFGIYGVFSIEAMASGRPVIASINTSLFGKVPELPIIPTSEASLIETIRQTITKPEGELKKIGLDGVQFVNKYHFYLNY